MIGASRAVALVREELAKSDDLLTVYWYEVGEGSRTEYAQRVIAMRGDVPVVPIALRADLFNNPNALLSDLGTVIGRNKEAFDDVPGGVTTRVCVLLLTRSRLEIPQVSSPVVLPTWFPVRAGEEVYVRLVVLADEVEVTLLNAEEARVERLSELLYEVETALVEGLEWADGERPDDLNGLFGELEQVLDGDRTSRKHLFVGWRTHLRATGRPRGYRPSVRSENSLVSLLIRVVLKSSPDRLARVGRELGQAIGVRDEVMVRAPMMSVLFRPTGRQSASARTGHAMLLAVYGAYQFITGAAHAGEYPGFSLNLIHSTSRDLRRALQDSVVAVRMLSAGL